MGGRVHGVVERQGYDVFVPGPCGLSGPGDRPFVHRPEESDKTSSTEADHGSEQADNGDDHPRLRREDGFGEGGHIRKLIAWGPGGTGSSSFLWTVRPPLGSPKGQS